MLRLIFILVLVFLALVAGSAVALKHYFGWKGLIAFPFILILVLWLGKKAIGYMFKRFALGLFSMKAGVLRGASMTVHSVTPVPKPQPEPDVEEELEDDDEPAETADTADVDEADDDEPDEEDEPQEYFAVDLTITPDAKNGQGVWEATEFMLISERISSLAELESGDKELGSVEEVKIWNGSAWGPDDEGKYPGQQRLLMTLAVKPGTSTGWLHYYNEPIGVVQLPRWQPAAS
jgi:hypothetical protein